MHNYTFVKYAPGRRAKRGRKITVGRYCLQCVFVDNLWITCGYVDNFLLAYVFILCVYGFLWGESDKFYMFECVVDNFVDNLWITFIK